MKKVYLVVQDKYRNEALEKLREVGVVHIENTHATSAALHRELEHKEWVEEAFALIEPYMVPEKEHEESESALPYKLSQLPHLIMELDNEKQIIEINRYIRLTEQERIAAWGDFDPEQLRELASLGYPLYLYELAPYSLKHIPPETSYIRLSGNKYAELVVSLNGPIPDMEAFVLPEIRLSEINDELKEMQEKLDSIDERLTYIASHRSDLTKALTEIEGNIKFEEALTDLIPIEGSPPGFSVSYLKGYIPDKIENEEKLKIAAKENSWAIAIGEPTPMDKPPTMLFNKPIPRLIKPVFDALGTIPGYWEFDISPSYLFFFSIFFAMIFGDAVYGLIIMSIAGALCLKSIKAKTEIPDMYKLILLLASGTIVWGALNGAWFSVPHESLPRFLQVLILQPFNRSGPVVEFPVIMQRIFSLPAEVPIGEKKHHWNIQFLCFTIAVIQLTWARGKRILKLLPSLSALSQVGYYLLVLGIYFLVLNMLLRMPFPAFASYLIGIGIAMVFVFSEQTGGNFFANIGKGLSNFFQVFLKIVGCFADIISYIRLFAVGLAGSMIGQIFNSMAVPAEGLGNFGFAFFARAIIAFIILVFGHGINFILNTLSVIVHGVRLNLLEYAGNHLDMEWAGYEYNPFAVNFMVKGRK
ncbi:MAG: hypothetical protein FWG77_10945 [Treponema sp.]|nr:hypothetical protein [Treponema sp.]